MNRRAEEILGLSAAAVVNHDLRALPSPLGDMLFETLSTGQSTARSEIHLARRNLALEVATYPVRGDDQAPLGAMLVFEDLTAVKRLSEERGRTEQLQLLTRVVARIADEIKNPLVSINTFMELIQERHDDPDFRQQFSGSWAGTCGASCKCSKNWPVSPATVSYTWRPWTPGRSSTRWW
jgi:nitrogen fixation/metabolism regulation signal transduction histidine kinase